MGVRANELLQYGAALLKEAGISDWDYDSRFLLEWVCHVERMDLILCPSLEVDDNLAIKYERYIKKRAEHEPLQYLIGEWEFMGLPFIVDPSVLIPRQDTESLVEWILNSESAHEVSSLLDVCTGSGCIAISLDVLRRTKTCVPFVVEALDISKEALRTAQKNNTLNEGRVYFLESNMFEKITKKYDIIVSNPPYIPTEVVDGLMEEVVRHEPRLALDGMADGLHFYRILAKEGKKHLKPGGRMYLEIGHDQGNSVPELLKAEGFTEIEVRKDLAGNDRCIRAVFPG